MPLPTHPKHKRGSTLSPQDKPKAICLLGPTASGKTALAIALARHLPLSLVNVDSAQVYRHLDIGAGKPDAATLAQAPHHLLDIRDPAQPYSAAEFREEALVAMASIHQQGRIPLLVGGTMLYFKALLDGLAPMPAADPAIRADIDALAAQKGWGAVHQRLAAVDPESAARIHPNDPQRLQRALEVYLCSGQTLTELHRQQSLAGLGPAPWNFLQLGLFPQDRKALHEQIAQRFHGMLTQGLVEEVRGLRQRADLHPSLPAIRAVGYRQVWQYLDGEYDQDTMIAKAVAATRQLAKRQITWMRSWPGLVRLDPADPRLLDSAMGHIQGFLTGSPTDLE